MAFVNDAALSFHEKILVCEATQCLLSTQGRVLTFALDNLTVANVDVTFIEPSEATLYLRPNTKLINVGECPNEPSARHFNELYEKINVGNVDWDTACSKWQYALAQLDPGVLIADIMEKQDEQTITTSNSPLNYGIDNVVQRTVEADFSNSVFISYRRNVSWSLARAIFMDLSSHNIDVFMDVDTMGPGQFDSIILNQIASRPYFLPLLVPGTLDHCVDPDDWVLREIKHAIAVSRVIIPLYSSDFSWNDPDKFLPSEVAVQLKRFNGIEIPQRYFNAAMAEIRKFIAPIETKNEEVSIEERQHMQILKQPDEVLLANNEHSDAENKSATNPVDNSSDTAHASSERQSIPQEHRSLFENGLLRACVSTLDKLLWLGSLKSGAKEHQRICLFGPIGSGKSSLLASLIYSLSVYPPPQATSGLELNVRLSIDPFSAVNETIAATSAITVNDLELSRTAKGSEYSQMVSAFTHSLQLIDVPGGWTASIGNPEIRSPNQILKDAGLAAFLQVLRTADAIVILLDPTLLMGAFRLIAGRGKLEGRATRRQAE